MLATVMPAPLTPYWDQTSSALMLAMPHSSAFADFSSVPGMVSGSLYSIGAYSPSTSEWAAKFCAMVSEPSVTLMALVAQKLWYFVPERSSSARILAWLSAAVFFSAAATAAPRSFQSLIAAALPRSALPEKWIQKSPSLLPCSCRVSSGRILSSADAPAPVPACAPVPVAASAVAASTRAAPALTSRRAGPHLCGRLSIGAASYSDDPRMIEPWQKGQEMCSPDWSHRYYKNPPGPLGVRAGLRRSPEWTL